MCEYSDHRLSLGQRLIRLSLLYHYVISSELEYDNKMSFRATSENTVITSDNLT